MRSTLLAALLLFIGNSMNAADRAPLRLQAATPAARIRLSDRIIIEARIQNVSDGAVSIYGALRWGHAGGLVLRIIDERGKDVQPKALDDDLIIPSTLKDRSSFVTLQERHFVGVDRSDPAGDLFPRAGAYTLWLEYVSPVPAAYGKGPNFWGRESGHLVSNRVRVEIAP